MSHFVTIYTDPLFVDFDFTHTFIGLTYKSPDELEKKDYKVIDLLKQQYAESSKLYYSNYEDNTQEINNACGF